MCHKHLISKTSSQKQVQSSIDSVFERDHIIDAEIRWCLKGVRSRYSQRSCDNVVKLFTAMFHKSKCGYVINHGIAPYWEHLLLQEVTNSPFYVLSLEQSLNKHLQKGQIILRYWNGDKFIVVLIADFIRWPSVNLPFLKLYDKKHCFNELLSLLNIGTCGLHTVHGSLKAAVKSTDWSIGKVLKAISTVLNDSPARRDIFEKVS